MEKIYFKNLNALRFLAALGVLIHHTEQLKIYFKWKSYFYYPLIHNLGKLGVVLFFVLSGFLITYLLLVEKNSTGSVSIKQFYIRRILRIWPLYYFVLILSCVIIPMLGLFSIPGVSLFNFSSDSHSLIYCLFIIPNIGVLIYKPIMYFSQSWSIGVEEQFYIIWPVLVGSFKKINKLLFCVIFLYLSIKYLFIVLDLNSIYSISHIFPKFWLNFNIDCMAFGGVMASILYSDNKRMLKTLFNVYFQIIVYLLILVLVFFLSTNRYNLHYELFACLFAIVIINFSSNPKLIISFENKLLNYLGRISYGIYMFHPIGIVLSFKILDQMNCKSSFLLYSMSILFTILISSISYFYFESFFLKLKRNFVKVNSSDEG